jgi:hypothetical protein
MQFRLSLTERKQGSILNPKLNREQYLRGIFTNKVKFLVSHIGNDFHYVPSNTEEQGTLIGNIRRNYVIDENSSPEEGFTPTSHAGWKAAVLIIDPTSHKDGQKIAMNNDKRVGKDVVNNTTFSPIISSPDKCTVLFFNECINFIHFYNIRNIVFYSNGKACQAFGKIISSLANPLQNRWRRGSNKQGYFPNSNIITLHLQRFFFHGLAESLTTCKKCP